jgi:hypothetical protein
MPSNMMVPSVMRQPGLCEAHGRKADRRLASTRFTDEAQYLAALQVDVHALDDRKPDAIAVALDLEAADFEKGLALDALFIGAHREVHSSCAGTSRPRN